MKNYLVLIMVLILATTSAAVMANENGPMLPAAGDKGSMGEVVWELYPFRNAHDDQSWVREYEGQRDQVWQLGTVNLSGYNGPWDYFLSGFDVLSGNTNLGAQVGLSDTLWFKGLTNTMTWRVPMLPLSPTTEPFEVLLPAVLNTPFEVERGQHSAELRLTPLGNTDLTFVADVWRQHDKGDLPLPFRTRVGSADFPRSIKFETTEPVDQVTTDTGVGANFSLGSAVISYRQSKTDYTNNVGGPLLPSGINPDEPIIHSRYDDTTQHSHVLKLSVPLGTKLSLSGNWVARNRVHKLPSQLVGELIDEFPGSDVFDVTSDLRTKAASLRYSAVSNLLLTASYREFDLDRSAPVLPLDDPENQSVNRHEKEGEFGATFTGIKSTSVRASFTTEDVDRVDRTVHPAVHEEWEHPAISENTQTDTFRIGATTYLIPGATLRANWKTSNIDQPGFHGQPSDVDDLTVGATISRTDDMVIYADYRRLDEKNNEIPAPGFLSLADLVNPAEYAERREASSGAQYSNKTDTLILGLYKSVGSKLTFDANFMYDKIDSKAYWILGTGNAPNVGGEGDTTGLPPELVPYNAKNKIWTAGTSYALTNKLTLRGNILSGKTDGMTTTDSLFRLVEPVGDKARDWQPINVNYWRASIGLAYRWAPRQQVLLEFSRNTWNDDIDPQFNGAYTLVTLGIATAF